MPSFRYHGFDSQGLSISGDLAAANHTHAVALLRQQGITPTEVKTKGSNGPARFRPSASARMLDDLAVLLEAGYTYTAALSHLASGNGAKAQATALAEAAQSIAAGRPLSASLETAGLLTQAYVGILGVAETLNKTSVALRSISGDIKTKLSFSSSLRKALAYPLFLLIALLIVLGIFLFAIFPTIENIYLESEMELPGIFMAVNGARMLYGYAAFSLLASPLLLLPNVRLWVRSRAMAGVARLPIARDLVHLAIMRDFLGVLEISVSSGSSVKSAFNVAEQLVSSQSSFYKDIVSRVLKGQSLGSLRPPHPSLQIALNLLDVGLKANKLADCAGQARLYAEQEIQKKTEFITAVAGPTATVLIGLLVGGMAYTMITALSAINNSGFGS